MDVARRGEAVGLEQDSPIGACAARDDHAGKSTDVLERDLAQARPSRKRWKGLSM